MTALAITSESNPVLAAIAAKTPEDRLREWLARLGPNTSRAYVRDLEAFAAHLGRDGIGAALLDLAGAKHAVALSALEAYRDKLLEGGLSSSTINRRLSAVNSALAELAKADIGHGRLAVRLVPHEARRDTRGPAASKIGRVVDELAEQIKAGDVTAARDLAIILLAAQRGLRRSEIANLKVADLRLDDCQILVTRKGKREKVAVEIGGATCIAMTLWAEIRGAVAAPGVEAVFVGTGSKWRGHAIGDHAVYDVIRKAGASIKADWHPHGLRHAAITEALRLCNGSLAAAQSFASHAQPATTMRYIDDKRRLERQAVDAMAEVYSLDMLMK